MAGTAKKRLRNGFVPLLRCMHQAVESLSQLEDRLLASLSTKERSQLRWRPDKQFLILQTVHSLAEGACDVTRLQLEPFEAAAKRAYHGVPSSAAQRGSRRLNSCEVRLLEPQNNKPRLGLSRALPGENSSHLHNSGVVKAGPGVQIATSRALPLMTGRCSTRQPVLRRTRSSRQG